MASLYLKEGEERGYASETEFMGELNQRDDSDLWFGVTDNSDPYAPENNFYASGAKVIPMTAGEIGVWDLVNSGKFDPEITQELATELICTTGLNVYVELPAGLVHRPYLVTELAFDQLTAIAGFGEASCLTLTSTRGVRNPMNPEAKAMCVNAGLATLPVTANSGKRGKRIKYLVRDRAVRNIASGESEDGNGYAVLPFSRAVAESKVALEKTFGMAAFKHGSISHIYDTAEFEILNPTLRDKVSNLFGGKNATIGVKLASSDCGLASLKCFPYGCVDGTTFAFGKEIAVEHKGNATIEKFTEQIPALMAIIQDTAQKLEDAKLQVASFPDGMFLRAAKAAGLPRKMCLEEVQYLMAMTDGTIYAVWWSLNRVVQRMQKEQNLNQFTLVKYQTDIFKPVLTDGFEDAKFDW